jgi:hypothetical protein
MMTEIQILLANSERQTNNRIEAQVLDVCFNQGLVRCMRTSRADELIEWGRSGRFQLIIVAAEHLVQAPSHKGRWSSSTEAAQAIHEIRARCNTPIIALSVFPDHVNPLLEAGADGVVRYPLETDRLNDEIRRLLNLAEAPVAAPEPPAWSLGMLLLRWFGRPKSA